MKDQASKEWVSRNELLKTHTKLVDDTNTIQEENIKLWEAMNCCESTKKVKNQEKGRSE